MGKPHGFQILMKKLIILTFLIFLEQFWSQVKVTQSCPTLATPWTPWKFPGQDTGVGSLSPLQGIFPTQGSNPGLALQMDSLPTEHKGSPRILEWVAYPFSSRSSQLRNPPGSPALQTDFYQLSYQGRTVLRVFKKKKYIYIYIYTHTHFNANLFM